MTPASPRLSPRSEPATMDATHRSPRARRLQLFQPVQLFVRETFGRVRLPRHGQRGRGEERVAQDKNGQSAHPPQPRSGVSGPQGKTMARSLGALMHRLSRGGSLACGANNYGPSDQEGVRIIPPPENTSITSLSPEKPSPSHSRSHILPPPALALPDELLSDIFIHCVPELASARDLHNGCAALHPFGPHPHAVRRCVTQVCRRWRTVAINTPSLWTTLVLGRTLKWDHENVQKWLTYSRGCPLAVLIHPRKWSGSKTRVSTLLRLFRSEVGRIRCFMAQDLYWDELLELFPLHSDAVTQLPLLEVFYVRGYTGRSLEPEDVLIQSDMGRVYAPKLQYLELAEASLITSFMTTSFFPIQYLVLGASKFAVPSMTYLQFLACCPDLSSLWFFNEAPLHNAGSMWPETRLTLPALHDLRFFADHTPDTMFFLRSLHLPAVLRLRFGQYEFTHDPAGFVLQVFWHLLTETASTLEDIRLNHESLPIGDNLAGPLIRNMANLKTVVIHDVQLKPDLLECLIPEPDTLPEQWPCPRLAFVTLDNVDIEGDALPRLIKTRARSNEERNRVRCEGATKHSQRNEEQGQDNNSDKVEGNCKDKNNERNVVKGEVKDMDDNKGWDMASISSFGFDQDDGRLKLVNVFHCCILEEETLAALVDLEQTHSKSMHFRR